MQHPPIPPKKSLKKPPLHPNETESPTQPIKKTRKSNNKAQSLHTSGAKPQKPISPRGKALKKAASEGAKAPLTPRLGSKEFLKLRTEWYKKLKNEGFRDLDNMGERDMDNLSVLSSKSLRLIADSYDEAQRQYYQMWCNYSAHNRGRHSKIDNCIIEMYGDGKTYRQIMQHINTRVPLVYPHRMWLWSIKARIDYFKPLILRWNKTHPEGIFFEPDIGELR